MFPKDPEQSINCCSENVCRLLYPILLSAYNAPVVEKAQQAPQFP
jgi:hypothetical protein